MTKTITDPEKIDEVLNRGTIVEILPTKEEFRKKMLSGERLRFYIGFDATAPTLHLSHAKNIMLLEKFRKLGHEVIILFGDFTARIGDPTGRDSARKQLSREEVLANVEKWKKLIEPLMDFKAKDNPPKIMYNHDWLSKLTMEDVINLASNFTVQQMINRDMFMERLRGVKAPTIAKCRHCGYKFPSPIQFSSKESFDSAKLSGNITNCPKCGEMTGLNKEDLIQSEPIYLHEFLYPLMQGYDSVAMEVDVEVCGTDQMFNALAGRTLLKKLKGKDKFVVAVTLMENPKTGELMSKSKGTGVFLDVSSSDMYGQIMAQPDEMIEILLTNVTYLSPEEIKKIMAAENPKDAKMRLALKITKIFHGEKSALKAQEEFTKIFREKGLPTDIPEIKLEEKSLPILDLLVKTKLAPSKNEAKRLVEGKAVEIDSKVVTDWKQTIEIKSGMVIKAGKRKFAKIA